MDIVRKIIQLHYDAARAGKLSIWTVYDHPSDYPDNYVARRFEYDQPTSDVVAGDLGAIRQAFMRAGLTCLMRNEGDDPKIVETWL